MKNRDWNSAFQDDIEQDWKAAMSSEVFRNFVKIALSEEQKKTEEENKKKFRKDTDSIMKDVEKAEDDSKVPCPIIENFPYDGDDYQEHKQRAEKARNNGDSVYDEFYDDMKVYHKKSNYDADKDIIRRAEEELEIAKMIYAMAQDNSDEEETTTEAPKQSHKNVDDLYGESGAGESDFIDLGLTEETLRELSSGIDYAGDAIPSTHDIDIEKKDDKEEELDEAEKELGLDKSALYILHKMTKRG